MLSVLKSLFQAVLATVSLMVQGVIAMKPLLRQWLLMAVYIVKELLKKAAIVILYYLLSFLVWVPVHIIAVACLIIPYAGE